MQQFIDKLISEFEKMKKMNYDQYENADCNNDRIACISASNAYGDCVKITNRIAEEYKKEWSKDYGWKLTKRFIEEKYFKRIYEISEKYDYPCENIALDMNWMFGLIEKIENKFTEEYKPRTNADRIRNMTDKELAEVMFGCPVEESCPHLNEKIECQKCVLEWLQSEVKDGD